MDNFNKCDLSAFDPKHTDKAKVLQDETWVPCRICREMFAKICLTVRFCGNCERAFCEGEHGSFVGRGVGVCVRCYNKNVMELDTTKAKAN